MDELKLEFLATIPQIQSALKIGQDSMRAQFDIPASELSKAINLAFFQGQNLKVTIEVIPGKVLQTPEQDSERDKPPYRYGVK